MRGKLVLVAVALGVCTAGLSGCFAIPMDPTPEDYFAEHEDDPEALSKLMDYNRRVVCAGFYPGFGVTFYYDMPFGDMVEEAFTITGVNLALLLPTILSWPTECGESYFNLAVNDHPGWFALLGYFKTHDPILQQGDFQRLSMYQSEAVGRFNAGEPFLDVARDIGDRSGLGISKAVVYLYRSYRLRLIPEETTPADAHRNEGMRLMNEGLYDQALAELREAVRLSPTDPGCHNDLGVCLLKAGRPQEAIAYFDAALDQDPKHVMARKNRAITYVQLGRLDGAVADLSEIVKESPSAESYTLRAMVLTEAGECDRALPDFQEALKLDAQWAEAYYGRGLCRAKAGQYGPSIADFTEAIRCRGDYFEAYHNRATVYVNLGSEEEAIEDLSKALEIHPNAVSYFARGMLLTNRGDDAKAIEDFGRAIELQPEYGLAYYQRGILYVRGDDKASALKDIRKAQALGVELTPSILELLNSEDTVPETTEGSDDS